MEAAVRSSGNPSFSGRDARSSAHFSSVVQNKCPRPERLRRQPGIHKYAPLCVASKKLFRTTSQSSAAVRAGLETSSCMQSTEEQLTSAMSPMRDVK